MDPFKDLDDDTRAKLLQTGSTFTTLAKDPKYRKRVLGLIKEAAPATIIPELDVLEEAEARTTERMKPVLEENKALVGRIEKLEGMLTRSQFASTHGLSEEELVEVETFAKDNGISKGDKAVALFRDVSLGRPRPTPSLDANDEFLKDIRKNARGGHGLRDTVMKQASKVLREVRGGKVR